MKTKQIKYTKNPLVCPYDNIQLEGGGYLREGVNELTDTSMQSPFIQSLFKLGVLEEVVAVVEKKPVAKRKAKETKKEASDADD